MTVAFFFIANYFFFTRDYRQTSVSEHNRFAIAIHNYVCIHQSNSGSKMVILPLYVTLFLTIASSQAQKYPALPQNDHEMSIEERNSEQKALRRIFGYAKKEGRDGQILNICLFKI